MYRWVVKTLFKNHFQKILKIWYWKCWGDRAQFRAKVCDKTLKLLRNLLSFKFDGSVAYVARKTGLAVRAGNKEKVQGIAINNWKTSKVVLVTDNWKNNISIRIHIRSFVFLPPPCIRTTQQPSEVMKQKWPFAIRSYCDDYLDIDFRIVNWLTGWQNKKFILFWALKTWGRPSRRTRKTRKVYRFI